jgi:protoheme IX farnesyltransferase
MLTKELGNVDARAGAHWRDYYALTKPGVVQLLVFTAIVGMFLATPGMVPLDALIAGSIGIGLAAAAAAAVNQIIDQRIDAQMARTRNRPLPQGRISERDAVAFALALGLAALLVLVLFVNVLTAALTFLSLIGYAIIYTVYLKRATPQNIVIGGAAGAAPPVLGWAAVTNSIDPHALLLFLIIFTWTPPHFWALALDRSQDYARVGVPMLPVVAGADKTRQHILAYTLALLPISLLPWWLGVAGRLYAMAALALGAGFVQLALQLRRDRSNRTAMRTFRYSIVYLFGVFLALVLDKAAHTWGPAW